MRLRHSVANAGEVTGYAVGLPQHTARDGGVIWYGGGKLAPDLTLPKLRARWASPAGHGPADGTGLPAAAARAVLRSMVTRAAEHSPDETSFFARLREGGVLVRLRFSQTDPGQVTGYSVTLPGHTGPGGAPPWYGADGSPLGLPCPVCGTAGAGDGAVLRSAQERSGSPPRNATPSTPTRPGRPLRRRSTSAAAPTVDPAAAADAAWAAADTLHVAARALRSRELRCAADAYDRAARAPHGRIPRRSRNGDRLRRTARLIALTGHATGDSTLTAIALVANLVALMAAVAELRQAQQHAAQAAAARKAAERMREALVGAGASVPGPGQAARPQRTQSARQADAARLDFPMGLRLDPATLAATSRTSNAGPVRGYQPPKRAGPKR